MIDIYVKCIYAKGTYYYYNPRINNNNNNQIKENIYTIIIL